MSVTLLHRSLGRLNFAAAFGLVKWSKDDGREGDANGFSTTDVHKVRDVHKYIEFLF